MMEPREPDDSSYMPPVFCSTIQADGEQQENANDESTFMSANNDNEPLAVSRDSEIMEVLDVCEFAPTLYMRRWAILASYCFLTISNLSSWYAFSSISNIIQRYYHINLIQVNWLAMTFSTVSIILMIPSYHLLEKMGLGMAMVVAGFFNAFGCYIRYIGYSKPTTGYWFLLSGNTLCAFSTSAFMFLPLKLAAVWFGDKERAKATSIAISADSLGLALGYFLPTSIVRNRPSLEDVSLDIGIFLLASTIESIIIFLLICISMKDRPLKPPSYSESVKASRHAELQSNNVLRGYKTLFENIHFLKILNIHGVLFGIESVFLVALNEMLIRDFPGHEHEIGIMGSVGLLLSIPTSVLVGILLDRTHAFKRITIGTTGLCSVLTALLSFLFYVNAPFYALVTTYLAIVAVYCTYFVTACNHSAELTYPVSEAQSGVILLWIGQVYGLIFAQSASWVLFYIGHKELLFCILGLYFICFILSFRVKDSGPRPSLFPAASL